MSGLVDGRETGPCRPIFARVISKMSRAEFERWVTARWPVNDRRGWDEALEESR